VANYKSLSNRDLPAYGIAEFKILLQHFCNKEHGDTWLFLSQAQDVKAEIQGWILS
jgi:hypothetical protein